MSTRASRPAAGSARRSAAIHVLGVRHHGPGSARMVLRAMEFINPDAVLVEGPPDAADVLELASHAEMTPPVALLVYEPEAPSNASYYPYAEFSPEWQAIRWGHSRGTEVRFIDLPRAMAHAEGDANDDAPWEASGARDPLDELAALAGFADGEAWWGKLIEERRGEADPMAVFDAIRETMGGLRERREERRESERAGPLDRDEPVREAHMRRSIRAALKEGFERIAVVCGAWHAPVLTTESLGRFKAKDDDDLLRARPKRKVAATWVPWTNERLSMSSGYGAGIASPGWYEHLWHHHDDVSERWLTRVARLMREESLEASPASVVEGVRLADSLAAMRGRALAGLDELGEATLAILCHGNTMPMRVIERQLIIGQRLGEVPSDAPTVPLQRDLSGLQRSLRMKVSGDEATLDLDQRKEIDLERSRLLHRLRLLRIEWGRVEAFAGRSAGTFHEVWRLEWKPDLSVAVIEAARWGNTVAEASAAFVRDRASNSKSLVELTGLLDDVLLADLPGTIGHLLARIQDVAAVGADVGHLLSALPALASVLRYGNVRKADVAVVEPVMRGLLARACAGLLPACGSLDDDAAKAMSDRIVAVHTALVTLDRPELLPEWLAALKRAGEASVHALVVGRCWRLLLDAGEASADEAATRLSLGLSRGNNPESASAWLEGFLAGSGMVLVHDERLLRIIDAWVSSLSTDAFEQVCPIARRTFSTFHTPERRAIGESIRRSTRPGSDAPAAPAGDDYDAARGSLVDPVLGLILGDRLE